MEDAWFDELRRSAVLLSLKHGGWYMRPWHVWQSMALCRGSTIRYVQHLVWVSGKSQTQMGERKCRHMLRSQHSTRAQALEAHTYTRGSWSSEGFARGRYPRPWLSDVSMPLSPRRGAQGNGFTDGSRRAAQSCGPGGDVWASCLGMLHPPLDLPRNIRELLAQCYSHCF